MSASTESSVVLSESDSEVEQVPINPKASKAGKGSKAAPATKATGKGGKAKEAKPPAKAPAKAAAKAAAKAPAKGKASKASEASESEGGSDAPKKRSGGDSLVNYIGKLFKEAQVRTITSAGREVLNIYVERALQCIVHQVVEFAKTKRVTTLTAELFGRSIKSLDSRHVLNSVDDSSEVKFPEPRIRRRMEVYTKANAAARIRLSKEGVPLVAVACRDLVRAMIPVCVKRMEDDGNKMIMPRHIIAGVSGSREFDNFVSGVESNEEGDSIRLGDFSLDFDALPAKSRAAAPAKASKAPPKASTKAPKQSSPDEPPAKAPAKGTKASKGGAKARAK